jgi:hypothetical protein
MGSGMNSDDFYIRVLECAGFYRGGQPLAGSVWSSDQLRSAVETDVKASFERIDRAFKYQAVLQPENRNGKIGVSDIFELSQSPCIYFKRWDAEPESAELTCRLLDWQQAAWNDGRAPMLWVVTPTHVRVINAYVRPRQGRGTADLRRVEIRSFKNIARGLEQLRRIASRQQIQSGRFWNREEGEAIDRRQRVDRQLIRDLNSAAEQLQKTGLELSEAHRLLLRAVFTGYLQARGWLPKGFLEEKFGVPCFNETLADPGTAHKMFDWLAEAFNGDVFPHRADITYTAGQLKELKFLLEGGDPKSKQRYLWPYEFDVIPVELLSSIYESFSHAVDPNAAEARSTHYTPVNLVELTLNEVFDDELFGDVLPTDAKVADLACGSGVFLVQALRRLVGRRVAAGEKLTRRLIRNTLYNQIFGVDILAGAVHIASVSLYLAALELDPSPGVGNGVKFKPLIYPDDVEQRRERRFYNLFEADAFDTKADFNQQPPFAKKRFSVVVGNPPWTRPAGAQSDKQEEATSETPLHVEYCRDRQIRLPNQDPPDQAFVWRAADFALAEARLGLILSGRRLFSHHKDSTVAKRDLLLRFSPLVMINLGQLRLERVFPAATHPGMIFVARNQLAGEAVDSTYATVERSQTFRRHGTLEIGPETIKSLSVRRAAGDEDFLKIASWGSGRDAALIEQLRQFATLEEFLRRRGARQRQGFIRNEEKEEKRTRPVPKEVMDWPCLEKQSLPPFGMNVSDLPLLKDTMMEKPREAAIYRGPLLLFTLGLTDSGLTSAICADNLVYSQRYYGIPLPENRPGDWACYLNALINSSLCAYFVFMTAAEWGVERDNVNGADLKRFPVPETSPDRSSEVQRVLDMEQGLRGLAERGKPISKRARRALDLAVCDLYGLDSRQRVLVEDTLAVTIELQRNVDESDALRKPDVDALGEYAEHFIAVINEILSLRNERKAMAEVFDLPEDCPLQVVKFAVVPRASHGRTVRVVARQELGPVLDRVAENLPVELATDVFTRRHVRFYGPGEVYLVKPAQVRFWTRSAGMNDADAVLAEHLRGMS